MAQMTQITKKQKKNMKTTQYDLYQSASAAATASVETVAPLDIDRAALLAFDKAGHDPADWEWWRQCFTDRRNYFVNLKGQPAPSSRVAPTPPPIQTGQAEGK